MKKKSSLFRIVDAPKVALPYDWMRLPARSFEFEDFAESYWQAATKLTEDTKVGSLAAFPAIYLYRHAVEVYIKAILIAFGSDLIAREQVIKAGHKLGMLVTTLVQVGSKVDWTISVESEALIREWASVDLDGIALKYPEKKGGVRETFLDGEFFDVATFASKAEAILSELRILFDSLLSEGDMKAYRADIESDEIYYEDEEGQVGE